DLVRPDAIHPTRRDLAGGLIDKRARRPRHSDAADFWRGASLNRCDHDPARSSSVAAASRCVTVALILHAHGLRLGEKPQSLLTAVGAETGLFDGAKRGPQVAQQPAVDPDGAAVETLGDAMCLVQVACPQCRG